MDESWTEHDVQADIYADLQLLIKSPNDTVAGRGLFELAIAHAIGFGTHESKTLALEMILSSAKKGYLPAQAIFHVWYLEHHMDVPVDRETQIDWLFEAVTWGSFFAGKSLQEMSEDDYQEARKIFHHYGGYNQYFYSRQRPTHIGSEEFADSISTLSLNTSVLKTHALLESAVVYGDINLTKELLKIPDIDPNCTNDSGESLVVLCCKGGHLEILKVRLKSPDLNGH